MINLMNHINSDRENPLFALAFSDADELLEYLRIQQVDVLVVSEEAAAGLLPQMRAQRCVYLTDYRTVVRGDAQYEVAEDAAPFGGYKERSASADDSPHMCRVFKYSKVRDIVAAIMKFMNIDVAGNVRRVFRSYAVISPIGRCGKTNLAVSLCMNDEVRGGLYIGMEEYGAFQDADDVISNVIFLAKERSDRFIDYVEKCVVKVDGYSVLGYLRSYTDAMELGAEDAAWMLQRLSEWGRYSTVVCDIGQAVLKDFAVLGAFDELVVPMLGDEQSQDKVRAFEKMLERAELGKVARRMKKVYVPNAAPDSALMLRLMESEFGR